MSLIFFGSIPLGVTGLTGPVGQAQSRQNTWAQYDVTRGKPVLHEIGEELDTQTFDFFFSEEFCDPQAELVNLEAAFALKTPMALTGLGIGGAALRYVVDALDNTITKTDRSGNVVRVESTITLLESPVTSLAGLITSVARGRAPALSTRSDDNPNLLR